MADVRRARDEDRTAILATINEAAQAYRDVIPRDCWHEPYMSAAELTSEIEAGVQFWCYGIGPQLIGVMGSQRVRDVTLIRHAYVRTTAQRAGVGGMLLEHIRANTQGRILVGTWAAAHWAIAFYQRHAFHLVEKTSTAQLLQQYWQISQRQIEESVVLANPAL